MQRCVVWALALFGAATVSLVLVHMGLAHTAEDAARAMGALAPKVDLLLDLPSPTPASLHDDDDDDEPDAPWPVVCPGHRPPGSTGSTAWVVGARPLTDLSSLGMTPPARDVMADVTHTRLTIIGTLPRTRSVLREAQRAKLRLALQCVFDSFDGNATAALPPDPPDMHVHTHLRQCDIPAQQRRDLDRGHSIFVRLALPFDAAVGVTSAAAISEPIEVTPHPQRCPAALRNQWRLPLTPPLFRLPPSIADTAYVLAVCTMVNSAAALPEWIEYHRIVGYEHFYVYVHHNASSATGSKTLKDAVASLRPYGEQGLVTVVAWPAVEKDWILDEIGANNHCLNRYGRLAEWLTVHDMDEYMLPVGNRSVPDILRSADPGGHAYLAACNWYYNCDRRPDAGTSGLDDDDAGTTGLDDDDDAGAIGLGKDARANSTTCAHPAGGSRIDSGRLPLRTVTATWLRRSVAPTMNERWKVFFRPASIYVHSVHAVTAAPSTTRRKVLDPWTTLRMCHYQSHRRMDAYSNSTYDPAMLAYTQLLETRLADYHRQLLSMNS